LAVVRRRIAQRNVSREHAQPTPLAQAGPRTSVIQAARSQERRTAQGP
jgi:hypothetical protein